MSHASLASRLFNESIVDLPTLSSCASTINSNFSIRRTNVMSSNSTREPRAWPVSRDTNKENIQPSNGHGIVDSTKARQQRGPRDNVSTMELQQLGIFADEPLMLDLSTERSASLRKRKQPQTDDLSQSYKHARLDQEQDWKEQRFSKPKPYSGPKVLPKTSAATSASSTLGSLTKSLDQLDLTSGILQRSDGVAGSNAAPQSPQPRRFIRSGQDQDFVAQVKAVLLKQSKIKTPTVGRQQARRILKLLDLAKPPDAFEALFASGENAAKQLESGASFLGIIVTKNQQPLPLQTTKQFLDEHYDDTAKVWIQDPAIRQSRSTPHVRQVTIGQVKERFSRSVTKSSASWNCLELATHVEDGLRPAFLNNEDFRLLTKLKLPSSDDKASRRSYEPGWKEVEKWALLAQAGALTEPHQDSHGYSTYITVNQGVIGFGWLANPTAAERKAWRTNPAAFIDGQWRYVILRAGETAFFPSGTVHFVFRLPSAGDTLAFGGHILRCSQIVRWVETLMEEQAAPAITNEDLTVSAPAYLERVERFVKQALGTSQAGKWGGEAAIAEFLRLKEEYMMRQR